jgi:zinc transport system ATP-binding protein
MAATDFVLCLNTHVCCSGRPETVSKDPAYLDLFGTSATQQLALYQHDLAHHDLHHGHTDGGMGENEHGHG